MLVPDNLKAAVLRADWYDPDLQPEAPRLLPHTTPSLPADQAADAAATRARSRRGVGYVQSNAREGREFASLNAQNAFLADWEVHIADTRIHGTTRKQVGSFFAEVEQPVARPDVRTTYIDSLTSTSCRS